MGPGVTGSPAAAGDTQSFRITAAAEPFPVGTGDADPLEETDGLSLVPGGAELVHATATSDSEIATPITHHAGRRELIAGAAAAR